MLHFIQNIIKLRFCDICQVRNEPSNIRLSCEYIARIKKVDIETVAQVMWENSLKLFPRIKKFVVK